MKDRLTEEERLEIIIAARKLRQFCDGYDCSHFPCPFAQYGICAFTTKPPKTWVILCLLEEEYKKQINVKVWNQRTEPVYL